MNSNHPIQVATIAAANYWPQVRVLADSLRAVHPDARVYALMIDLPGDAPRSSPDGSIVACSLDALNLAPLAKLASEFTITELCTAVKPRFLNYLFRVHALDRLLFLDPDVMVFHGMQSVWDRLATSDILLTPHFTDPSEIENQDQELLYLRVGTFNLGFIGLKNTDNVRTFLDWWDERTMRFSCDDSSQGIFTDQQWINLVPGMFRRVEVLEHPGLNVAFSNVRGRCLRLDGDKFLVNGQPLIFFHFHKFRIDKPPVDYFRGHLDPATADALFSRYAQALERNGLNARDRNGHAAYGTVEGGQPFPAVFRRASRLVCDPAWFVNGAGPLSLDEIGRKLARDPQSAAELRASAYLEHRRCRLGSEAQVQEAYRASWWFRCRVNAWFYLFGPRSLKFPIAWVETSPWLRRLRRGAGACCRGPAALLRYAQRKP